jgi:predicted N-acetyltransferase YhbS
MIIEEISISDAAVVNSLVSRAFQYQAPHSFFDDFPVWASDQVTRLGIYDDENLISHVGFRLAEMRSSRGIKKIALIGAVATDEKYRGKGHSTTLLKEAIKRIEAAKCEWSILWGSEHEFYAKLGFELAGVQARAPLSSFEFPLSGLTDSTIKKGLNEAIFKLLCSTQEGIVLKEKDRTWLFAHKTVQWFSVDHPFAFVGYERGMDLKNIVHDMAAIFEACKRSCFKFILKTQTQKSLAPRRDF